MNEEALNAYKDMMLAKAARDEVEKSEAEERERDRKLQREMITKKIPEEYRPLYEKVRAKAPAVKVGAKGLSDALISIAMDTPQLLVEAVATELARQMTHELTDEKFREERSKLAERDRDQDMRERRLTEQGREILSKEHSLSSKERKLKEREEDLNKRETALNEYEKRSKDLEPIIMQMESPEARDRLRMYMLFRHDIENTIQTAQNNTAFIAASGAVLAGTSVPMSGDLSKMGKSQQQEEPVKMLHSGKKYDY